MASSRTIPEWIALICYRLKDDVTQNHPKDDESTTTAAVAARNNNSIISRRKTSSPLNIDYRDAVIRMGDNGRRLRPIEMETLSIACIFPIATSPAGASPNYYLQSLDLSYALDDPNSIEVFVRKALPKHKTLKSLSLSCNGLQAMHAQWIATALSQNSVLEEINLDCNRIGPIGAIALAESLIKTTGKNKSNQNNCNTADVTPTTPTTTTTSALIRLGLGGNQIRDEGAHALANMLRSNTILEVLGLSYNQIGTKGVRALMEALTVNRSLRDLDLSINNNATSNTGNNSSRATRTTVQREGGEDEDWCQMIAACLSQNSCLTHLSLYFHNVTLKGASALERALKLNYSLEVLKLDEHGGGGGSMLQMMTMQQRGNIRHLLQDNIRMKSLFQKVKEHQQSIPVVLWPNVLELMGNKPDYIFHILRARLPDFYWRVND